MGPENTIRLSNTPRGLRAATALLRDGRTVAFPTETVYGLGADARNGQAVARIYQAKGRPKFNPLIVHVATIEQAAQLVEVSTAARDLMAAFWPGPLTLVLPLKQNAGIADLVTAGLPTLAVRMPAHPSAHALLAAFGGPLAAPSANPSGKVSPTTADHVMEGLTGQIAGVLDAGACEVGLESTIIGFDGDTPVLLRPGGLPVEVITKALGQPVHQREDMQITAPGQMTSHYAPEVGVRLEAEDLRPGELRLGFGPLNGAPGLSLTDSGDLTEAAANLFAHLRTLDGMAAEMGADGIAVAPIPETGLGAAINDRLRRAAAPRD